ncbi:hypothetical protein FN846DRAFT_177671 [Sphaerosporella brunnea]|uniref:Rhodopsin domain-containing protein n=1 Tax=Sphaerosporella brunnea TaxID=1250544 RepID=A0A5J5ER86_9PEZI|nr:hypothetical protein FN846DRAFT_177671 [Sphaerosporella brunnea]
MLVYPKSKFIAWIYFDGAFTILVLLFSGLRFYQQRKLRPLARSYVVGNVAISLSNVCITAWTIVSAFTRMEYIKWEENPVGYPPPWRKNGHFLLWLAGYWYLICLWLIKLSFISTYFRVVPHLRTWARKALYITVAYVACSFVVCVLVHSLYCRPATINWIEGPSRCSPWLSVPSLSVMTAFNMSSDIGLLIIPLLVLRELHLRKVEVFAFVFVYAIGSVSIFASLLRYIFIRIAYRNGLGVRPGDDLAESIYRSAALDEKIKIWTTVEYSTASIAFCLPSLRNMMRRGGCRAVGVQIEEREMVSSGTYVSTVGETGVTGEEEEEEEKRDGSQAELAPGIGAAR